MIPETNHEHSQLQTLNNSRIALTLCIEKGQHIYGNYYSARIKLSNESKDLLYKNLSKEVKFDSLDKYVELSPKSFYIYSRDNNGKKAGMMSSL
ncbi:MAG: hypothetical protein KTV77_03965 [Wolbachia endosymbiont of Fragariocoptes setiger]|nr:hypothetical protein [Wolbachia endosymbiont of Fragariocoptes setiger]